MQTLVLMSQAAFERYLGHAVTAYAEENIRSGEWPAADAMDLSRKQFARLLPDGIATPDHYLLEIHVPDAGSEVGVLWLAVEHQAGRRRGFVYDVCVYPQYRRRGYATLAFQALEGFAGNLNLSAIELHVFAHNSGAQALYEGLGYRATDIRMRKSLADE